MLREFITKHFFFLLMLCALFGFVGIFFYAVELEGRNVPPANMHMPDGAKLGRPSAMKNGQLEGNLSIQHLSSREVSTIFSDIIAETLSFNKDNFTTGAARMQKYFTPEGYKQYADFLGSSGLRETLESQDLESGAYIEQNPMELAKGVYDGAYKWVFEVPVTISFRPRDSETYRDDQTKAQNRRFMLRVQFARVKDTQNPDIIKIENWQVLPARAEN